MIFHSLLARLLPLLLLLPLMNAHAADTAAQAQPGGAEPGRADPKVWGAYAQLVGHRFKGPTDRWPGYEIVWSKPGEEIRETKLWFNTGEVEWSRLVRPGARAGELVATGTGEYHNTAKDWVGTIGADGAVSFALQNGLLKAPYRVIAVNGGLKFEHNGAPPFAFSAEALPPAATAVAQTPATGSAATASGAATNSAAASTAADPAVWGVYAHLVGHRFKAPSSGSPDYEIVWTKPGEEIRESAWYGEQAGATQLIRRGDRPGELISTGNRASGVTRSWVGTIDANGAVLFVRDALAKMPYRVSMTADGALEMQAVRLKDDKLAAVTSSTAYTAESRLQTAVAAIAPAPGQAAATGVPARATAAALTNPASGWGVLEKLAGKTWQMHNTGRWESDTKMLTYRWSADRSAITWSSGDGYTARQIGTYRVDPATGSLIAKTQDEDGKPIQAPAQVDGNGAVTVQTDKKRRSVISIDSESGALKNTVQKLTWGGDWKDIETFWYFNADPGPEWGVFSKLVGYNWDLNGFWSIHFRWLPQSKKVEAGIYRSYDLEAVVEITRRADHPQQFIANGEGVKGILDGGAVGLVVLEGADKATQVSGKNRHTYELLSHPDRLVIHSQRWLDGELKPLNNTYTREDQARKNERIAGIKRYHEARAASERTDRWLAASAALGGALQAANEVAAARVAQSQAELDATLDAMAEQASYERMEAAAQQAAAEEAARQRAQEQARENEQDAAVAAAMAQVRQLAREAGDEGALDRAIAETNRAIDQQEEARQQRIAEQEREARLNAQQQMKQFVQSSQAQQAQQARPQNTPKPAATATTAGSAASVYMGCVAINSTIKVAYLSDIARIAMEGEQERWNAVFFTQHIARTQNLPERDFQNHCYIDRNGEAGASNKREQNRKTYAGYGFSIVELDWSPEQRY